MLNSVALHSQFAGNLDGTPFSFGIVTELPCIAIQYKRRLIYPRLSHKGSGKKTPESVPEDSAATYSLIEQETSTKSR